MEPHSFHPSSAPSSLAERQTLTDLDSLGFASSPALSPLTPRPSPHRHPGELEVDPHYKAANNEIPHIDHRRVSQCYRDGSAESISRRKRSESRTGLWWRETRTPHAAMNDLLTTGHSNPPFPSDIKQDPLLHQVPAPGSDHQRPGHKQSRDHPIPDPEN